MARSWVERIAELAGKELKPATQEERGNWEKQFTRPFVDAHQGGAIDQLAAVMQRFETLREHMIQELQEPLRELLQRNPPAKLEDKRKVEHLVNRMLSEIGLAFRYQFKDKETGQMEERSCSILVLATPGMPNGYFALQSRKKAEGIGGQLKSLTLTKLSPLELMVAPREEAMSHENRKKRGGQSK